MGCDIFSWVEVFDPATNRWTVANSFLPSTSVEKELLGLNLVSSPFRERNYGLFGFLADVRNTAGCEPLDSPRKFPEDYDWRGAIAAINQLELVEDLHVSNSESIGAEFHSHSWFLLPELLNVDYESRFWNRIVNRDQSYRELLGPSYFGTLDDLKALGNPVHTRILFCFAD